MGLQFLRADLARDRDVLRRFNTEYFAWIGDAVRERFGLSLTDLMSGSIADYVDGALDELCDAVPPYGVFYLAFDGDTAVGMGELRRVRDLVGEIKRIYVSKTVRGAGVGAKMLAQLMDDARWLSGGYSRHRPVHDLRPSALRSGWVPRHSRLCRGRSAASSTP